jgi:hypothetical protein
MKTLRQAVGDYLSLRRSLGFKLKKHESCLRELVSFLKKERASRISTQSLRRDIGINNRPNGRLASASYAGSPATAAAMIWPPKYLCPDSCLTVRCVRDLICIRKKRSDNC